jgi:hypothetical protein
MKQKTETSVSNPGKSCPTHLLLPRHTAQLPVQIRHSMCSCSEIFPQLLASKPARDFFSIAFESSVHLRFSSSEAVAPLIVESYDPLIPWDLAG